MKARNSSRQMRSERSFPAGHLRGFKKDFYIIGDPGERQSLIDLYPDIAARMRQQLDAWSASVDRNVTGADYPEGKVLPSGRE